MLTLLFVSVVLLVLVMLFLSPNAKARKVGWGCSIFFILAYLILAASVLAVLYLVGQAFWDALMGL